MGDLSTREQIRREAVERLARAEFEDNHRSEIAVFGWTWDGVAESMRDTYRLHAGRLVRALGDLLPTGIEWGVRYEAADITPRMDNPSGISTHTRPLPNEAHARAAVANGAPIRVANRRAVSRYAHDWIEVSE